MKNIFAVIVSAFALCLSAAEVPNNSFVRIPANPEFTFAGSLNPRSREAAAAKPITAGKDARAPERTTQSDFVWQPIKRILCCHRA